MRVALGGETRTVDVGRVALGDETRYFANVGSAGMSGSVARRANSMSKRLGGRATFFYALTREFLAWQNTEVTVRLDGGDERRGAMHDVIVAIGRWHGGGMHLAPDASQDDGLFDVVFIGDVNKLDFLTTAPKLYSGKYLSHPKVDHVRSATRRDRRGRAAAGRGRRRADRDDAGAVRGRPRGCCACVSRARRQAVTSVVSRCVRGARQCSSPRER